MLITIYQYTIGTYINIITYYNRLFSPNTCA